MFWCLLLKGGQVYLVPPSPYSRLHFLSCLPALPVVVGGGGQVYMWDWGVDGGGM